MKRNHGKKKENSENTYNVEIHNFCYIPKKLMYFSFSLLPLIFQHLFS